MGCKEFSGLEREPLKELMKGMRRYCQELYERFGGGNPKR